MENINAFQEAIKAYGVPTADVFQTVDLFEKKDIAQVTQCIYALGRTVSYICLFFMIDIMNWLGVNCCLKFNCSLRDLEVLSLIASMFKDKYWCGV